MRFSVRKLLKLTIIIGSVISLNIILFISEVKISQKWDIGDSFSPSDRRHGVSGEKPVDTNMGAQLSLQNFHRIQRSAKSMSDSQKRPVVAKIAHKTNFKSFNNNPRKGRDTHVTVNNKHRQTELSDVFISVKTTKKFHESRINLLLKTWVALASDVTYFFTDTDDAELNKSLGGHLINTNCSSTHSRKALCCKMSIEYDTFIASNKRWFCHMDDDTYVNVPQLLKLLQNYNHREDWYLGKPSLKHPIEIIDRDKPGQRLAFWFATGGAGFCISRGLALKMMPYASGGRLMTTGEKIRLPDDCTVGYIIDYVLKKPLTTIKEFHSHLEPLWMIQSHHLHDQITFSYGQYSQKTNVVNVPGFSEEEDPSRLMSIHCHLFPSFKQCRQMKLSPTTLVHYL